MARDERPAERRQGHSGSGGSRADFVGLVRDALAHLYDPAYLQTHPLTRYLPTDPSATATRKSVLGRALRQALLESIEALHPGVGGAGGVEGGPELARHSTILQLRFVEGLDPQEVQSRLAISRSQFYREQQTAIEGVCSVLEARWGVGAGKKDDRTVPESLPASVPLAGPVPEIRAAPARRNLPLQLTSFVGRERELAEARRLLGRSRLLTLTGAGGSGKTRLALETAEQLTAEGGDYPDGIWLIELAALTDPRMVPQSVAYTLDVREQPGRPILETLLGTLRSWRALLILDCCEHLLEAAAGLAHALLRGCPNLKLLVTSREALGIEGETTWRVPSLDLPEIGLPDAEDLSSTDRLAEPASTLASRLAEADSVRLFVERAQAAVPSFELTNQNAATVAEICRRLDGIPLALELAATRTRGLSVEQIVSRLDQRFLLLTGGSRAALPRQQTLRAAIDWSYDLLSDPERLLFQRLTVFSGGFGLAAAEEVAKGGEIAASDVLDLLLRLIDKSLVVVEAAEGEDRYRLLETLREYAWAKLRESGGAEGVQSRHADHYLGLAEDAAPALLGPKRPKWLSRLDLEHDNLRSALGWSLENDASMGLRLGAALWWFWHLTGRFDEGRRWLEALLAKGSEQADPTARAQALLGAGFLAVTLDDLVPARSRLEESLTIFREVGDRAGIAQAMGLLGRVIHAQTYHGLAKPLLEESLAILREMGDLPAKSIVLLSLSYVIHHHERGRQEPRAYLEEGLVSARKLGDWLSAAHLHLALGGLVLAEGDSRRAREIWAEGVSLARENGDRRIATWILCDLGNLETCEGNYSLARGLLEEAVATARAQADQFALGWRLLYYGNLLRLQGELHQAKSVLEEVLAVSREFGDRQVFGLTLVSLGNLARVEGNSERARALLDEGLKSLVQTEIYTFVRYGLWLEGILALQGRSHDRGVRLGAVWASTEPFCSMIYAADRAEYDVALAEAREALGEEAFAHAWAEGQAMTLDQAVEYALQGADLRVRQGGDA